MHNIWDPEIPFNRGQPYSIGTLMYVDGSNVLHPRALSLGIYNPFYIIPDAGHTSFSSDFFGTVTQPWFDSTVWYMKNFFAYKLGCSTVTYIHENKKEKKLSVFPNPTIDEFYLDGIRPYAGQVLTIEDISGKEVYRCIVSGRMLSTRQIGPYQGFVYCKAN